MTDLIIDNVAGYVLVLERVAGQRGDHAGPDAASVHVAYPRPVPVGARVRFAARWCT